MWDLPRPGLEPVSTALAGRHSTTAPPGKPYASFLFPRFWIIFTIITLNSFSGRLTISSSFIWSCGFLPCSFICCIFLCLLTLSNVLFLRSPFCRLQGHSSSCFWCLPPVLEVGPVACIGLLVGETGVCVLVTGAGSCPSDIQGHVRWCVLGCL